MIRRSDENQHATDAGERGSAMSKAEIVNLSGELVAAIREAAVLLEHDGHAEPAIRLLKYLLKSGADRLPLVERARLRAALAGMVWKEGHTAKARVLAADAVRLAEEGGDATALSEASSSLGEVSYIEAAYMGQGDLSEALAHHERSLALRREIGDRRGESLALSRIGVIHERMDAHDRAQACYEQALGIAEELDFPEGMSRPYVHVGAAKERAGDLAGALADYRRSVAAVRRAHDVHALAFDLCNVAWAAVRLDGDLESALALLREALDYAERMNFKLAQLRVHQVTGEVYAAAGRRDDAAHEYEMAIDLGEGAGLCRFVAFVRERLDALQGAARNGIAG